MSVTFHVNDLFPIICLICGVVTLIKPKYFHTVVGVLLLSYGFLEVVNIKF